MKSFLFKKFSISQSKNVFRVGTDGVLLGVLAQVEASKKILEVGTGSGLISLMLAQRNSNAEILAIDYNEEAVKLASENFENSIFHHQLKVLHQDFKEFETTEKFDLIISNPPYFEANSSSKDILARQQTELSFENLVQKSASLLAENGRFSVIIPYESGINFEKSAIENGLFPLRKIKIFGIKNSTPKRWILEFGLEEKEGEEIDFTIEKSPRIYSEEYLELTKDFHVFQK